MRKIIFLLLIISGYTSKAQVLQTDRVYGRQIARYAVDSVLQLPRVQANIAEAGRDTGKVYYNKADSSIYIYTGSAWRKVSGGVGSQNLSSVLSTGNTANGVTIDLTNTFGTTSYGGNYVDITSASSQATLSASNDISSVTLGSVSQKRAQLARNADSVWTMLLTDSGTVDIVAKNGEAYIRLKRQTGGGEIKYRFPWSTSSTVQDVYYPPAASGSDTISTRAYARSVAGSGGADGSPGLSDSMAIVRDSLRVLRDSINSLQNKAGVKSAFGRQGVVVADETDYLDYYPRLSQSYSNPSWIFSLPWSKITGTPTTISGYGITNAMAKSDSTGSAGFVTRTAIADSAAARSGTVFLLNDVSTTNTTATNTGLKFAAAANTSYRIVISGTASKATSSTGLKIAVNGPSGSTIKGFQQGGQSSLSTAMQNALVTTIGALGTTFATGTGVEVPFRIEAVVTTSSTAGDIELQFATVTSNTATIFANTSLMYSRATGL